MSIGDSQPSFVPKISGLVVYSSNEYLDVANEFDIVL